MNKGAYNLTALPLDSGYVKFNWIGRNTGGNLYYILCTPESYSGDYQRELTYLTTFTSAVLTGFQESRGYVCTLTAMDDDGNQVEETIQIHSLGEPHGHR